MTVEELAFEKLTAIFPINELYFLAQQERLMKATKDASFDSFPITRLISRKDQQDGTTSAPYWQGQKQILPWEEASYSDVLNYRIKYDSQNPQHTNWNLQETVRRNKLRKIKAVFIDQLILTIQGRFLKNDTKEAVTQLTFECTPIPRKSMDTLREVRGLVTAYSEKYHLYPNVSEMSKQDKRFFNKLYVYPSCLELKRILNTPKERLFKLEDKSSDILNSTLAVDQQVFWKLSKATGYQIIVPHKKHTQIDGFIFDGVISQNEIQRRLREVS